MITVNAIKCPKCEETIYSRAHHDFHRCHCGNSFIDGGFDYTRIGAVEDLDKIKVFPIEINATKDDLYNDWNTRADKFGWISKDGI